jgi:hypothetical protein
MKPKVAVRLLVKIQQTINQRLRRPVEEATPNCVFYDPIIFG